MHLYSRGWTSSPQPYLPTYMHACVYAAKCLHMVATHLGDASREDEVGVLDRRELLFEELFERIHLPHEEQRRREDAVARLERL